MHFLLYLMLRQVLKFLKFSNREDKVHIHEHAQCVPIPSMILNTTDNFGESGGNPKSDFPIRSPTRNPIKTP